MKVPCIRRVSARISTLTAACALATLATAPVSAQQALTSTAADRESLSITVYTNQHALVRDSRRLRSSEPNPTLVWRDISPGLLPESVRLVGAETRQLRHLADPLDLEQLLARNLGQLLRVSRPGTDGERESFQARLLGHQGQRLFLKQDTNLLTLALDTPGWQVEFPAGGPHWGEPPRLELSLVGTPPQPARLFYLTPGLDWQASHQAHLASDGATTVLESSIQITNTSSYDFGNASWQVVAGDVPLHAARPPARPLQRQLMMSAEAASLPTEQPLASYHLFSLPDRFSLGSGETLSTRLYAPQKLTLKQLLVHDHYLGPRPLPTRLPTRPDWLLKLTNGDRPLPQGPVAVYTDDLQGRSQFLGSVLLPDSPAGQEIPLSIGKAFDVTLQHRQTSYKKGLSGFEIGVEIELRNASDRSHSLEIREHFSQAWDLQSATPPPSRQEGATAYWSLNLAPGSRQTVRYQVRLLPR